MAEITAACLKMLGENVREGVTTRDLDGWPRSSSAARVVHAGVQGIPGLSGLDLRLPELHDRTRYPRRLPPRRG